MTPRARTALAAVVVLALGGGITAGVLASRDDEPSGVTLVGSFQSELGCAADWQDDCAATTLGEGEDGTFAAELDLPAGTWEYQVAVASDDGEPAELFGRSGRADRAPLVLAGDARVRFTFDPATSLTALTPLTLAGGYAADDDALVAAPVRHPGADERFYFVLTDRFANGDPGNDTAGLGDDRLVSGFDPTDKGFFHGGDLAGLRQHLDYVEGLGTTAIWLTPVFANRPVQGEGADASAGYHGYWVTDFTRVDPHLGTNADLEALIEEAHARGMKVYLDIITNHTADVIDYVEGSRTYLPTTTHPYRDADGAEVDVSALAGSPDFPVFDPATSFPYTPVVHPGDETVKVPDWLNDVTRYHHRGNSTWSGESVTFGDFSGLDDLMTEDPVVVDGMVDIYRQWVDLGVDGFRIDTVKHVNVEFWEHFTTAITEHAAARGRDDFFMFGEVFDADARLTSTYVRRTDMDSVLDFAFQQAATAYASGGDAEGLRGLFASDDHFTTPTSSADALPTFLGNHDMGRAAFFLPTGREPVERLLLAHDLMYLTRGQPVVYYGDEQGFAGRGGDKDARQSLFATQVEQFQAESLVTGEPVGAVDRFDTDALPYQHLAGLAALRDAYPALSTGAQLERYADEGPGVYALSRVERTEKVEHLVAFNSATEAREVTFTTLTSDASYTVVHGPGDAVTSDADRTVTVTVPPLTSVVWVADRTVDADTDGSIRLSVPVPGARITGSTPVRARIDDAWAETSFAWRPVGTDEWHPLGTAETHTPRVFHDVDSLDEGLLVEYRAVTVDADGDRAAASTFASVGVDVSGVPDPNAPATSGSEARTASPGDGPVVSLPGSFQDELGCPEDWAPGCELTVATDDDGDGVYTFATAELPGGAYEVKVAHDGSWDVNFGAGGVRDGDNVTFTSDDGDVVTFAYDSATHVLTVEAAPAGG